ncbi:hypothetical protein QQ25_17115 [Mycolicibacterium setense]|nr:hypothetical protein QQ25_17115 [Mycolicibacterium setense]
MSASATDGVLADDVAEEVSVSEPHAASAMVNDAAQATSTNEEGTRKEFILVTLQPHGAGIVHGRCRDSGMPGKRLPARGVARSEALYRSEFGENLDTFQLSRHTRGDG